MSLIKNLLGRSKLKLSGSKECIKLCSNSGIKINEYSSNLCKIKCEENDKTVTKNVQKSDGDNSNEKINCEQTSSAIDSKMSNNKSNCERKGTVSVAIVGGGATCISTSILLKQNPLIKEIHLVDMDDSLNKCICDIKQIDTFTNIKHYKRKSILNGLRNVDIVALMDETYFSIKNKGLFSQFIMSSSYVKSVAECSMNACPNALIAVFARPVTATVPLVSKVYEYSGSYNPNKIIGSAALELMRIATITATFLDLNPSSLSVPIAGGVDSVTIVPLLSRTRPFNSFTEADKYMLIHKLRSIDKLLSENELGGPTISSGLAAAKFISILVNGLKGQKNSVTSAYVKSNIFPSCQYMTTELQFGPHGVRHNFGFPKILPQEIHLIEQVSPIMNRILDTVDNFVLTGGIK